MLCYETYLCVTCLQILADAMGLGKTVMTIALILSNPRGECSSYIQRTTRVLRDHETTSHTSRSSLRGGTLIICPMPLLGQWKVKILCFSYISNVISSTICLSVISMHCFIIIIDVITAKLHFSCFYAMHLNQFNNSFFSFLVSPRIFDLTREIIT